MSNVIHCPREDMRIGLRVKPWWLELSDGRHLPLFQPDR